MLLSWASYKASNQIATLTHANKDVRLNELGPGHLHQSCLEMLLIHAHYIIPACSMFEPDLIPSYSVHAQTCRKLVLHQYWFCPGAVSVGASQYCFVLVLNKLTMHIYISHEGAQNYFKNSRWLVTMFKHFQFLVGALHIVLVHILLVPWEAHFAAISLKVKLLFRFDGGP